MAREQHTAALVADAADELTDGAGGGDVEAVGRLVEQYVVRAVDQGAGQGHLHGLALGETLGAAIGDVAHVEHDHQLVDAALERRPRETVQAAEITHRLARREPRIQPPAVGQDADPALHLAGLAAAVESIDPGAATIGPEHGVEYPQSRRLAGAVGADESGDLAVVRGKADAARGMNRVEGFFQALDFNHGCDVIPSSGFTKTARGPRRDRRWRFQRIRRAPDNGPGPGCRSARCRRAAGSLPGRPGCWPARPGR